MPTTTLDENQTGSTANGGDFHQALSHKLHNNIMTKSDMKAKRAAIKITATTNPSLPRRDKIVEEEKIVSTRVRPIDDSSDHHHGNYR
jgi:hypothetical protein